MNEFIQNQRIRHGLQDPPPGHVDNRLPITELIHRDLHPDEPNIDQVVSNLAALRNVFSKPPSPLNSMVARLVAETARKTNEICPITMDTMTSCKTLYVPTCGHVCSDAGCLNLQTYPICRVRTAWASVAFTE